MTFVATDNEFIIGLNPAGNLEIHMQAHATTLPLCCNHDINALFNGWHKHCFTYKAGGSYKVKLSYLYHTFNYQASMINCSSTI